MRIDHRLPAFTYTKQQKFFLGCWYNMTHQFSIDSYRLRTMNPVNSARELAKVWSMGHANSLDKYFVFNEAIDVIEGSSHLLDNETLRLVSHLKSFKAHVKKDKATSGNCELVVPIATALYETLDEKYITFCETFLRQKLIEEATANLSHIKATVSNLLSALIDKGSSIESLFHLYKGILVKNHGDNSYPFEKRIGLLFRIIKSRTKEFKIAFSLTGITSKTSSIFPDKIGEISFHKNLDAFIQREKVKNKTFSTEHNSKKYAVTTVDENDARHAGTLAYEKVYKTLDLIRFEFNNEPIKVSEEFICLNEEVNLQGRIFGIPKVVPNPVDVATIEAELAKLVEQVETLVNSPQISDSNRDRIISSFRFFRYGSDTNIFENKLVNWWTAIEYLTSTDKNSGNIGERVVKSITPILCLHYIQKLLLATQKILGELKYISNEKDINTYEIVDFRNILISEKNEILEYTKHDEYIRYHIDALITTISSPTSLHTFIISHKERLELQLQRIYRARCDIVHSADLLVSPALLCANLEFYLKQTLRSVLEIFITQRHLSSTQDFFRNATFRLDLLLTDLKSGSTAELEHQLSSKLIGF